MQILKIEEVKEFPVFIDHFSKFYLVENANEHYVQCVYPSSSGVSLELFEGRTYNVYTSQEFQEHIKEVEGISGKVNNLQDLEVQGAQVSSSLEVPMPDVATPEEVPSPEQVANQTHGTDLGTNFGVMPEEGIAEKANNTEAAKSLLERFGKK